METTNNIHKILYLPWRYPRNWLDNIKLFFRKRKWAYQRITRGFCDYDVWDLDVFYKILFRDSLRQLASTTHGWPQSDEFPEFEDWQKYLNEIADLFEDSFETSFEKEIPENPYEKEYVEKILNIYSPIEFGNSYNKKEYTEEEQKLWDNYWETEKQIDELRQSNQSKALDMLKRHFNSLWD